MTCIRVLCNEEKTIWRLYIPVYGSLVALIAVYSVVEFSFPPDYESFRDLYRCHTHPTVLVEYALGRTTEVSVY